MKVINHFVQVDSVGARQNASSVLSLKNFAVVPLGASKPSQAGVSAPCNSVLLPRCEDMSVLTDPGQQALMSTFPL